MPMTLQSSDSSFFPPGLGSELTENLTPAIPMPSEVDVVEHISTALDIFHGSISVFVVAFVVTLLTTPVMRWLATRYTAAGWHCRLARRSR